MNILLGVCGSIAAYKSYDLCRMWIKDGHKVRVVTTKGAQHFVMPNLYTQLGCEGHWNSVDDFSPQEKSNILHIELAKWADIICIAPTTANTLNKIGFGIGDDLLTNILLASHHKPILIFPAMNNQMLSNPITQKAIKNIKDLLPSTHIFSTQEGLLACGDFGEGKLEDIEKIFHTSTSFPKSTLKNKTVLITTGATVAPIDPVRFLSNSSSGITGFHIAKQYLKMGYQTIVVAGKNSTIDLDKLIIHPNFKLIRVATTNDMFDEVSRYFNLANTFIASAAASDFNYASSDQKIKKDGKETIELKFTLAQDILAKMINSKTNQKIVGFAAETGNNPNIFLEKWNRKPTDLLIGNFVHNGLSTNSPSIGFGTNQGEYYFIKNGRVDSKIQLSKQELAERIFNEMENLT